MTTLLKRISKWPATFKMADYLRLRQTLPSRLSTNFPAYFYRITNLTYQTHYVAGHKQHGKRPPDRPWRRWKLPLQKTLTSLYLGFRLPFLGIYTRCSTENHLIDLDIDGTPPLEKTLNFLISAFDYFSWVFMQDGGLWGPYYYWCGNQIQWNY